jgi:hypothetical protein
MHTAPSPFPTTVGECSLTSDSWRGQNADPFEGSYAGDDLEGRGQDAQRWRPVDIDKSTAIARMLKDRPASCLCHGHHTAAFRRGVAPLCREQAVLLSPKEEPDCVLHLAQAAPSWAEQAVSSTPAQAKLAARSSQSTAKLLSADTRRQPSMQPGFRCKQRCCLCCFIDMNAGLLSPP